VACEGNVFFQEEMIQLFFLLLKKFSPKNCSTTCFPLGKNRTLHQVCMSSQTTSFGKKNFFFIITYPAYLGLAASKST